MKKNVENKPINFEDTLYILHSRIQLLQDILALDIPANLFLDKSIDDMEFIDKTLEVLIKILSEDTYIMERDEQLDNFSEAEWQFSQILVRFLSVSSAPSAVRQSAGQYPVLRDKLSALRNKSAIRRKIADDSKSKKEGVETIPIVSSDEMSELLKGL
ncbi:MAG: hypothetical protein LBF60_02835 [Treponema sp.]|jgi:hypothetical protein|nr:hypothetical protein [Treponema sp.]